MSKRDLAFLSTTSSTELEPRTTKRRKETQSVEKDDVSMADDTKPDGEEGGQTQNVNGTINEEVKEQGLALWQTVKEAVNKECVTGNY
jgi:hypothetical protein